VHALRALCAFGDFQTDEVDLTPALGVAAIVMVFFLLLQTA
jgi:hypothetical protein